MAEPTRSAGREPAKLIRGPKPKEKLQGSSMLQSDKAGRSMQSLRNGGKTDRPALQTFPFTAPEDSALNVPGYLYVLSEGKVEKICLFGLNSSPCSDLEGSIVVADPPAADVRLRNRMKVSSNICVILNSDGSEGSTYVGDQVKNGISAGASAIVLVSWNEKFLFASSLPEYDVPVVTVSVDENIASMLHDDLQDKMERVQAVLNKSANALATAEYTLQRSVLELRDRAEAAEAKSSFLEQAIHGLSGGYELTLQNRIKKEIQRAQVLEKKLKDQETLFDEAIEKERDKVRNLTRDLSSQRFETMEFKKPWMLTTTVRSANTTKSDFGLESGTLEGIAVSSLGDTIEQSTLPAGSPTQF
ncbi:hypothetical protein GUITHDRAFT_101697 [Guillardia theta CCMP2712]|uniref:PA domain-containing protein n=1 Tax=Guillardia theta (strain CCMP2712) TaxID=905079 RepID=L1JW18_GUITC|nr:hypothetical protein GUITHDRAFT_101697 [Guillardia theta CCMP2712]EKX52529.1 hypothetical protein GUITHDRAFT_101697 [Guillardia theta CCMP2712]|eukprot:XP_005839509.1 hypothetical protein GUITHDRAFT_101697 [Guillardia theta CCMP2712]